MPPLTAASNMVINTSNLSLVCHMFMLLIVLLLRLNALSLFRIVKRLGTSRIAEAAEKANLAGKCESTITILLLQKIFVAATVTYRKRLCLFVILFSIFKLTYQLRLMKGTVLNSTFGF